MSATKSVPKKKSGAAPGQIVFTGRERALIAEVKRSLIDELMERLREKAGIVDAGRHAEDHDWWHKVRPWVESQATAAAKREEFWTKMVVFINQVGEKVLKDSVILLLKILLIVLALTIFIGKTGALKFLDEHLPNLFGLG